MKTTIIAASMLALMMGVAQAAEGNSEPFPNTTAGNNVVANQVLSDRGSDAGPRFGRRVVALTQGDILPSNGSEGVVQTANSVPRGFEEGTVTYAQAQSMQRWALAHQAAPATRLASRSTSLHN